jgi:hypothetical protein
VIHARHIWLRHEVSLLLTTISAQNTINGRVNGRTFLHEHISNSSGHASENFRAARLPHSIAPMQNQKALTAEYDGICSLT